MCLLHYHLDMVHGCVSVSVFLPIGIDGDDRDDQIPQSLHMFECQNNYE